MKIRFCLGIAVTTCCLAFGCGTEPSPWTATSKSVAVECNSFFGGSARYEAERSQLTDEQLRLLEALEPIDADDSCPEDAMTCSLSITQADDSTVKDYAFELDKGCGRSRLIAFKSFDPFRKTLGCQYSKDQSFPPISPDSRCYNGVFVASDLKPAPRVLKVDAPGLHRVEFAGCTSDGQRTRLHFTLSAPDGTLVGEGMPVSMPSDDACLARDVDFPAAGEYRLAITVDEAFLPLGDIFLRFL